jgi:hypothetical protein
MRKFMTAALAALTFGAAVAATASPAQARPHGGSYYGYYGGDRSYYRHRHRDNDAGVAIAAGVVGLALGAALAGSGSGHSGYYRSYPYRSSYGYGYYEPGYGYGGYSVCESRRWVYDPYIGRRVQIRSRYAC